MSCATNRPRAVCVSAAALLVTGFLTPHATAAVPECRGRTATIVGTSRSDRLIGTSDDDVIYAGPGNDVIRALDGDDRVCGGPGRDLLIGGSGDDVLVDRDTPSDALYDKLVYGGPGDDLIDTARSARVWGGPGADTLTAQIAYGEDGNDVIRANQSEGGAGDDLIIGVGRYSRTWFISSPRGVSVVMARRLVIGHGRDKLKGIRYVDGTNHDDKFFGTDGREGFGGLSGNDVITLGTGDDRGHGGNGDDIVRGGPGKDWVEGYAGDDLQLGGRGADYMSGRAGTDETFGGPGNDEIDAGPGAEVTRGGPGNDKVSGGWGGPSADVVFGGDGHDLLTGGDGDDELHGGRGVDLAYFQEARGAVTASLETGVATARGAGTDTMYSLEGLMGTTFGDTLEGNARHNVFYPGAAFYGRTDVVNGNAGDDLLLYESYSTSYDYQDFDGGPGSDWVSFEVDRESTTEWALSEDPGADNFENVIAGPRPSELYGNAANNILIGGNRNDLLNAGDWLGDEGDDVLVGFEGQDECLGGERVRACEAKDGGDPLGDLERPSGCRLAAIRFVPSFEEARGLWRFCGLL